MACFSRKACFSSDGSHLAASVLHAACRTMSSPTCLLVGSRCFARGDDDHYEPCLDAVTFVASLHAFAS